MLIQPDFSEVLDEVPAGTYKARIVDAQMKESQKGDPYVKWQLTIFDADNQLCNGKSVWTNTMISGKAAFRLKQLYAAATKGQKPDAQFDTVSLMSKELLITVVPGLDKEGNTTGFSEVKAFKAI